MKTGTSLNRFIQHLFMCLLCLNGLTAQADDNIITHTGDRYIIHVDKMNPDSEMTLMDVLHTCPEFLSLDGKTISSQYSFRIDNIEIFLDRETFLTHLKACEIERIHICTNASVSKAVDGTRGVIDIYYRRDAKTDGKVALSGSTYGNGKVYADNGIGSHGLRSLGQFSQRRIFRFAQHFFVTVRPPAYEVTDVRKEVADKVRSGDCLACHYS